MTRGDLRRRILLALNDDPTSPVFWSVHEVDDIIHEAQEVIAEEVAGLKKTAFVPKRDGATFYSLASVADDVMAPFRVFDRDKERRLRVISMQKLDQQRMRFWEVTGDQPHWWYPVNWNLFGVYPSGAEGGGWLEVNYLAWPTEMIDDDESPLLPEADHDGMVLYGVYLGLMQQWDAVRALDYFTQFLQRWGDSRIRHETRDVTQAWRIMRRAEGNGSATEDLFP